MSLALSACFRFVEKGNLEVLLFTLQSRMRANNQKPYLPREGKMLADINRAWDMLEKAEHERELALREELIRCADTCPKSVSVHVQYNVLAC